MDNETIFDKLVALLKPHGFRAIGFISQDNESFRVIRQHFPQKLDAVECFYNGIVRLKWHQNGAYYHARLFAASIHCEGSD